MRLRFSGQRTTYNFPEAITEAYNWLPNDRFVGLLPTVDLSKGSLPVPFQPIRWTVLSGPDLQDAMVRREPNLTVLNVPYLPPAQSLATFSRLG